METRYYTKADLMRKYIKRGERRPREAALAGAILSLTDGPERQLGAIRRSREALDALHGPVLDFVPRLRNLCYAIDAASAETEAETEPETEAETV